MAPPRKGKKFSNKLLKLLGIKYVAEGSQNSTTVMTSDEISDTADGLVIPKQLLDRYKIQRSLGFGGYGSVFLARDFIIGRLVALKILNKTVEANDVIYDHFIQEARIAGQLDHENIVVIYNVEEYDKCACIVMEYLAEGNLALKMKEHAGGYPLKEAVEVIDGILDGLSVAHKMKVIHRDIKPENILFDPKGRPKISDFGIAHIPKDHGGVHGPSEYKPVGTPTYMAPEQLRGRKSIDNRVDLYSTGTIFYEMLTGHKPYVIDKDMTFKEIIKVLEKDSYRPISDFRDDVPKEVVEIIDRLLKTDRDERYLDAKEVLNDLKNYYNSVKEVEEADKRSGQFFTSSEALLEDVMRLLLVDGIMSPAERRELNRRGQRLKVSPEKAREIENKIRIEMNLPSLEILEEYQATVTLMAGDGVLSDEEQEILKETSTRLGIQDVERQMIEQDALEQSQKGQNNEDS